MSEPMVAKVIVTAELLDRVKGTMSEDVTDEEAMRMIDNVIQEFVDSNEFEERVFNYQN